MRYALKPADPSVLDELPDEMPNPGMNAKTALLAGIVVGVCLMVGMIGFMAWREKQAAEDAEQALPAPPAAAIDGSVPRTSPPR